MTHHATNLIADYFREKEMKFSVHDVDGASYVDAGFSIPCGPAIVVHFISRDEDNDVAIRIFSLISSIPSAKEDIALRLCNELSRRNRSVKFYLSEDNSINMEYDLSEHTPDEAVGPICHDMFMRMATILFVEYAGMVRALNGDGPEGGEPDLLSLLRNLMEAKSEMESADAPELFS